LGGFLTQLVILTKRNADKKVNKIPKFLIEKSFDFSIL